MDLLYGTISLNPVHGCFVSAVAGFSGPQLRRDPAKTRVGGSGGSPGDLIKPHVLDAWIQDEALEEERVIFVAPP